jgi:hypothetical protein
MPYRSYKAALTGDTQQGPLYRAACASAPPTIAASAPALQVPALAQEPPVDNTAHSAKNEQKKVQKRRGRRGRGTRGPVPTAALAAPTMLKVQVPAEAPAVPCSVMIKQSHSADLEAEMPALVRH